MELPKLTINPGVPVYSTSKPENPSGHFFSDTKKRDLQKAEGELQTASIQDHGVTMIACRCGDHEEIGSFIVMLKEMSATNLHLATMALKDGKYSEVKIFTDNVAKAANAARDYEAIVDAQETPQDISR